MVAILENLRGFANGRPPAVLFMICLLSFTVVLLSIAYIVKVKELHNPDVTKDWNTFLERFAKVDFCMQEGAAFNLENVTTLSESPKIKDVVSDLHNNLQGDNSDQSTVITSTMRNPEELITVAVPLWVAVMPTTDFVNTPHSVTHLTTTMSSDDIGMKGPDSGVQVNLTLALPFNWTSTLCPAGKCPVVNIQTCVHFQAPAKLFPRTRKPDTSMCYGVNETVGVEYHAKMVSVKKKKPDDRVVCGNLPSLQVRYKLDPTLAVMLSLEDRSLINLHLMHTSYFLFVMVVSLLCYALIRGRPKPKLPQYTEVPQP